MDTIYFFAIKEDLNNIFGKIEEEFDIKYCEERADVRPDDTVEPQLEFNSINEIVCEGQIDFIIAEKSEEMNTYLRKIGEEAYYTTDYDKNRNSVVFFGGSIYPTSIGDYQIHIHIPYGSVFAANLFKRIVKEVKKNCVKIKNISPFYVGKEMYKYKDSYAFMGQCFAFPVKITDDGEAIRWWSSERVRQFMGKPLEDQLVFLKDVLENRIIKDYKYELKNYTETYQMFEGVMLNVAKYKEFDFFHKFMLLFNDESKITSPLVGSKTAMEELKDIVINLSFARKEEGIQVLLDSLEIIPDKGYNCGSVSIVKTLLQKKYFDTFKKSLVNTSPQTKKLVLSIFNDITEKRLVKLKDEIICFLNSEV